MESSNMARLIQIHPDDNVGVLSASVKAGQVVEIAGEPIEAKDDYGLGHKFALADIMAGGKVLKYGISIGSASCDIPKGDHVHLHNLQSDYLPTYTLGDDREFEG